MMNDPDLNDRDPVDILAEEFAERLRRGEHPSVSDYATAHPQHADQLRELLPAVAQMEMLKRFRYPATAEKSLPDRLGDFRIVRELGRGGMGIVFEAVQESLGRPVALKVLARHAQLDSMRRERFVREAQAAAKLHHTNIVPVFGVGEQDGLPYYVMQLIHGSGLHAIVSRWRTQHHKTRRMNNSNADTKIEGVNEPSSDKDEGSAPAYGNWRFIAEIAAQAAYALHYAHKQGVLHRDVKPANLIYDSETVWITDFGLAKLMDIDGLTATGDILGTLQYLPPECLNNGADARSDVYGLGATLYELLTLDPPYTADSPARLLKQVADADPVPPRELNAGIPRDLETIVLKAMAREPQLRYATASEFAEDLEAFLEDRPIKARRSSPVGRAWRWCRRNPAVASLTLSTLVALTLAAVAGWIGYARAEERRNDAEKATAESQKMSAKLEANLKLSLQTFERVFYATGDTNRQRFGIPLLPPMMGGMGMKKDGMPKKDGFGPGGPMEESASDKAAILEAILNFYDKFAEQNTLNPELQFEAAKASRRVCEAHIWLKRPKEAVIAFRRAVGLLEPLAAQFPDNDEMRAELVIAYAAAPPDAFTNDRDAPLRRAEELARDNPRLTGIVQFRIGFTREQSGDRAGAEAAYRAAVASLTTTEPSQRFPQTHLELASARFRLAWVLADQRKFSTAREVLEQLAEELHPFVDRTEGVFQPGREWMGMTYGALAGVREQLGDRRGADEARANASRYGERFNFGPGGPGGPKRDGPPGGMWPFDPGGRKKDGPPGKKDGPKN